MRRRSTRHPQQNRSPWQYVGAVLVATITCGLTASGWFSLHKEPWSIWVKPPEVATTDEAPARVASQTDFGKLPLYFVENRGQVDKQVAYYVHGRDTQVYFTTQGLTFVVHSSLEQPKPKAGVAPVNFKPEESQATSRYILKLDFVGSNPHVQPRGEEQTEAVISYFKGNEDQWQTGLKTYQKVVYPELWPGIDLVYSGDSRRLKYTFVVKPGADPKQIQFAYRGATDLTLTDAGQLQIHTPEKVLTEDKPYTYQEIDGKQIEVPSAYQLTQPAPRTPEALSYSFQLGAYDVTRPLVIDPVVFVYAGYIGGAAEDVGYGIAVDSKGNAYVTGWTRSTQTTFPDGDPDNDDHFEVPGFSQIYNGGGAFEGDAFVAKINANGTALVYASYIGGVRDDVGRGIMVDKEGNAYVVGWTISDQTTFPSTVGPDLVHNGNTDAFVAKVNAAGTALEYAGYIGGTSDDRGLGIAVDRAGHAYITGWTQSNETTFPDGDGFGTQNPVSGPDTTHNGNTDAFVVKVRSDGTGFIYAGYIGGSSFEQGYGIAVDSLGNTYVTGWTRSTQTTFPDGDPDNDDTFEVPSFDQTYNGNPSASENDAFVVKVNAAGTALVYAGYIGGAGYDVGNGIAVDSAGNAYITGETQSNETTFPDGDGFGTLPGPDSSYNGSANGDAFVAKVHRNGRALVYAGYIGGTGGDTGTGIAVDSVGNAYVTGYTTSSQTSFPVTANGPDSTGNGFYDAFAAKVNAAGTSLIYAGYIGGLTRDLGYGTAVDSAGNAYVVGATFSNEVSFPDGDGLGTLPGPDKTFNSVSTNLADAFIAKIGGLPLTGMGVFRPSNKRWYLDANRDGLLNVSTVDKYLGPFGASGDIPIVGKWNKADKLRIGSFKPSTRVWRLDLNGNGVWDGTPTDKQLGPFGVAGDLPIVGDWTGNGITRIGVFRPSTGIWYLDKNNNGKLEACTIDICQGPFGKSGDRAVAGDWSGNGKAKIGVYRPSTNRWMIDFNGNGKWNGKPTDKLWAFGTATDQQVVGDWTGDGKTKIGFFRPSTGMWYLDNGDGVRNAGDLVRGPFGATTDKAVAGAW